MNPGDWENCVPENIKIGSTVLNEATEENVNGSFGTICGNPKNIILTYTCSRGTTSTVYQYVGITSVNSNGTYNFGTKRYYDDQGTSFTINLPTEATGNYLITYIITTSDTLVRVNSEVISVGQIISGMSTINIRSVSTASTLNYALIGLEAVE